MTVSHYSASTAARQTRPVHSTMAAIGQIAMRPPPCRAARAGRRSAGALLSITARRRRRADHAGFRATSVGTAPTLVTATARPRRIASAIATPYPSKYDVSANRSAAVHSASVTSSTKRTRGVRSQVFGQRVAAWPHAPDRDRRTRDGQFPVEVEQPAERAQQHVMALARDQRADRQDLAGGPRNRGTRQVVDAGDDDADPVALRRRIRVSDDPPSGRSSRRGAAGPEHCRFCRVQTADRSPPAGRFQARPDDGPAPSPDAAASRRKPARPSHRSVFTLSADKLAHAVRAA